MQVRIGLLNKRPDWTDERFYAQWRHYHGALAAGLPGLLSYVQNHVTDSAQRGISFTRGPERLDGISQLVFKDEASMRVAIASVVGPQLAADEAHFIGRLRIVTVQQHVVVPLSAGRTVERMSLLRRRADVTPAVFAHEWRAVHGPLVRRLNCPGAVQYVLRLLNHIFNGNL